MSGKNTPLTRLSAAASARKAQARPRTTLHIGPSMPGWILRLGAVVGPSAVIGLSLLRVYSYETSQAMYVAFSQWSMAILAVLALWWPRMWQPLLATVAAAGLNLAIDTGGSRWLVLPLVVLCYLSLRVTYWASKVSLNSRVELAVFARALRADSLVLGATVVIGALGLAFDGDGTLGLVVGAVGAALLAWWLHGRSKPDSAERSKEEPIGALRLPARSWDEY